MHGWFTKPLFWCRSKKKPNNGEWTLGKTYQSLHWKCWNWKNDYVRLYKIKNRTRKKNLSPQTIHHCLSLLRRVLNKAYNWKNFNNKLPSFNGILPKFDNARKRFLTKKEVELIIKIINKIDCTGEWSDIILFALNTGIRKSEIFNLTFNNINLIEKFCIITDTKSSKDRIVPLNETSYNIVIKRLNKGDNYLFHGRNSKIFYKVIKISKINDGVTDRK